MNTLRGAGRRLIQTCVLALLLPLLSACGENTSEAAPDFAGSDISGTGLGQGLALTDHHGAPRTLADYAGRAVVVFFGFTQCPDVCPTSLAEMAQVMHALGEDADRVQVLFITVDPERDTPAVLRQYVTAFDARFVGLTGTPEQIRAAAASFKVSYAKVPLPRADDGGGVDYTMDHTAALFLLDQKGQARVLSRANLGAAALAHDLRLLL